MQARERCGIGVVGVTVAGHGPQVELPSMDLVEQAGKLDHRG